MWTVEVSACMTAEVSVRVVVVSVTDRVVSRVVSVVVFAVRQDSRQYDSARVAIRVRCFINLCTRF